MSNTFEYKVKINASLPQADAELIYKAMQNHPDIKRYTKQGEFAFAFVNLYSGQDVNRSWSIQELDKISKALEWPYFQDVDTRVRLWSLLAGWVKEINQEYQRIQEPNEGACTDIET